MQEDELPRLQIERSLDAHDSRRYLLPTVVGDGGFGSDG